MNEEIYLEEMIRIEDEWWNSPKNRILNFLTLGTHGLRHVGLL